MKKKLTILLAVLLLLTCVPTQSNAGALTSKLSSAISKVHEKDWEQILTVLISIKGYLNIFLYEILNHLLF